MLVLLWGLESDPPLAAVSEELDDLGVPTEFVDQRQVLNTEVRLEVAEAIHASLRIRDQEIDLSTVTAAYVRPYDTRELPAIASAGPQSFAWAHALEVDGILASWVEITSAFVVNRFGAAATNNSKPYQLKEIHSAGFSVPETLVTTEPKAAQAFWEHHGKVIYKSVSAIRSRVARLGPEHASRLGDIVSCPTQFQQYIAGIDHRVHVVGDDLFASEVRCDADDYRYPGQHRVEIRACRVPDSVEERCRRLAAAMQLAVAGVDLRQTPEGDWYCFEVNPSPGFTFYEVATGQPIAGAVARLLANGYEYGRSGRSAPLLDQLDQKPSPG
jgi:glutathione synthase/RimK-type ligase-like ATP-grasp enzyme